MANPYCLKRAAYGAVGEQWVVDFLKKHQIPAEIQPQLNIPQNQLWRYSEEQFDILINYKWRGGLFTIEAKRRKKGYQFTSLSNFIRRNPHFKTLNVDKESTYKTKKQKPFGYIIVNPQCTAAIFIPNQPSVWVTETDSCGNRMLRCPFEYCLDLTDAIPLIEAEYHSF